MVDYVVNISASTSLMIRDTGGWVEFWMRTGAQTWNNDQQYSFFANGSYSGILKFRLVRGGGWQYVNHVYVTYDQDIAFGVIGAGIGFPTYTFNQHIQRSTVPQPPYLTNVYSISSSAFHVDFAGGYDGGSPIVEWQIGYGSSSNYPVSFISSGGSSDVGGFYSGQRIYFWARARNAIGWSDWSNRGEGVTWQVPPAAPSATFYDVLQTSVGVDMHFQQRSTDPPNLEWQIRYGRDATAAIIDGTINVDQLVEYLYTLDPGKTYYFWGRTRNSVGWGPWSPTPIMVTLIAGARVLVVGQWKRAVPYVRTGGVWKVAEPWVKDAGIWKRTSQ
jgi:hypothetical protein